MEKRVDFAYDADNKGLFTSIARYGDLAGTELVATSNYQYDDADNLTSLTHTDSSAATLAGYTWRYDSAYRLTQFTVMGHPDEDVIYTHDATNQLIEADRSGTSADESYSYDANGNRTNVGYATGTNNQLLTDATYNYTYDDEGNRTRKTGITDGSYTVYEWDYHNRLVSATDFNASDTMLHKVSYTYDIFGRLIGRELDANGDTIVDESGTFIYDGDQILLVLDETGDVDHRLLWGAAVDQILFDENSSGDINWMLTDHQNTVRDIVQYDEATYTTSVVNHLEYDAFGNATTESDPSLDVFNLQYTARYFDEATGLQYNNARWYDAATGQWISQDPIEFEAGDGNLYRYVGNGPTNWTDPSGLERKVTLPDGSIFKAKGTGHHRAPWNVFSDPKYKFSREVMEMFDGSGRNALINGQWYNFHDGSTINGVSHNEYSTLVRKELDRFIDKKDKFGPDEAQQFLDHLGSGRCSPQIRKFNNGVKAERDLAKELGDLLYDEYKKNKGILEWDSSIRERVSKEVGDHVRKLRSSSITKQQVVKEILSNVASKLPGKRLSGVVGRRMGSALVAYFVISDVTEDGRVQASEVRNSIAMNLPILGDSIQVGLLAGDAFDYIKKDLERRDSTGDKWMKQTTPYDPGKECPLKLRMHGIEDLEF